MTLRTTPKVWHFPAQTVNDYYADICRILMQQGTETSPRGEKTKELHPTTALIEEPRKRLMSCYGRVLNLPFALAEAIHIITGQNDAQAMAYYSSNIIAMQGDGPRGIPGWEKKVATFNAAYGERMRGFMVGTQRVDQLEHVIQTLKHDPDSRQASIVISHPYSDNFRFTTNDKACNVYAHAMIRGGKLDWMQVIRSNDAVWGIPYNVVQWSHVQEWVAAALGVPMGHMFIVQDSFHVYERHYRECEEVKLFDLYEYLEQPPIPMIASEEISHKLALAERDIRHNVVYNERVLRELEAEIGPYWRAVIATLQAFREFKSGADDVALEMLPEYSEFRAPMLRQFCYYRWNKDKSKYANQIQLAYLELASYGVSYEEVRKWLGKAE
jgi:thymidylate synthase